MKNKVYHEMYLDMDMEDMGYIFEYCDEFCKELFNVEIDRIKFLNDFMNSNLRKEMEEGHAHLLTEAAKDTIEKYINIDCNGDILRYKRDRRKKTIRYAENQLYWVGYMYAYLHFNLKISSKKLIEIMPIDKMLEHYYTGHQMDNRAYLDRVKDYIKSNCK